MKLNLLPTYASHGKSAAISIALAVVIVLVCILATLGMTAVSQKEVNDLKDQAAKLDQPAKDAVQVSEWADEIVANSRGVILNAALAQAMLAHNSAYPDFYDRMRPYIPSFFRVTNMSATPLTPDTAALTLTGVIETQEQYRDLMLALNHIPDVISVARAGYEITEQYVPPLTDADQKGRPILRGDQNIPDDPLARLQYLMAKGGTSAYTGAGGFGSGQPGVRGAMPKWSAVTVAVVVKAKLETPDPKKTLSAGGAAPATPTTGGGGTAPSAMSPTSGSGAGGAGAGN